MASVRIFPTHWWKKTLWRSLISILLLILCFAQGHALETRSDLVQSCKRGILRHGHIFKKGKNAGTFSLLAKSDSVEECVDLCCRKFERSCQVALFLRDIKTSHGSCYAVKCTNSKNSCETVAVQKRSLISSIFIRDSGDENPANQTSGHESCHHYHGHICNSYLEKGRLLFFNQYPRNVEMSLAFPFKQIKGKLSKDCMKYALPAICVTAFPSCSVKSKPKANYLCRKDCENLYNGVCRADLKYVKKYPELTKILPSCERLPPNGSPEDKNCVKISVPDPDNDLDNDKRLMKGAMANDDPEEETGDVGELNHNQDLHSLKGTENHPAVSYTTPIMPFTAATAVITPPKAKNIGTVTGFTSPAGAQTPSAGVDSIIERENSSVTPSTLQNVQIPQALKLKQQKSDPVNGKANSSSASPPYQSGNDDRAKGRTSETKTEIGENVGVQQSDPSKQNNDSHIGRLEGLTANRTKHLQESLGILDPGGPTTKPKVSQLTTVFVHPTNSTENISSVGTVLAQTPKTEAKSTMKEKKHLSEPTASSLPTTLLKKTASSFISPTPSPVTQKQPSLVVVSNKSSLLPVNTSKAHVNASQGQITPTSPSLVLVNSSETETNYAQTSGNVNTTEKDLSTTGKSAPSATAPPLPLHVSAGSNKEIVLPANTVSLYASAWPKETEGHPYSYHWQQMSAPQGSHGYMQGQETKQVTLTQLDKPGVYQFKVKVTGSKNAIGFAYVNVTVKPVPRVNKPPRADVTPKEQTITLPTNEVVLDGRKSSDDDKIAQYKWEEVKGPLNDKNKVISSGSDSPILQLKSLVPGVYTFKLTVVDSDGATDSTTATVTVNNEKDYPPVARASHDVVLTLPVNSVTLNGNSSTDDKGIASYEWSKTPTSPAVGDMQGTTTAFLKVSNLVVGDYTFILKVTDARGQSDSTKVTVVVQPEKNEPPVARAGSDKDLVFPDDTTTLDANGSRDDQKIVKYQWEQIQGPAPSEMIGANSRIVTLKKLQEGHYVFKLTVTDQKGLTGHDNVAVNVKKDINTPPEAKAGPDVVVHLPNRAAELDGSQSTDDQGVAMYLWIRDPKSPAAGDVINNSDHQAVLRLSNLVEGMYKFKLTVADNKGLKSDDEAIITVKEDEHSAQLVELYLDVDITRFTEENKEQLIRKLAVILNVEDQAIIVEHIKEAGTGHSVVVMFYVKEKEAKEPRDGQDVSEVLKEKIENEEGFFEFRMLKVDPYICRNNCSGHGYCDRRTKLCVCESFWMQDIFKANLGAKESNCDWSILYVTVIIFGIIMGVGGIIWGVCFCMGRYRRKKVLSVEAPALKEISSSCRNGRRNWRGKRRHRYAILDDEDEDEKAESMEMLPKGKYFNGSMMLTDSDEDSDEETTLFEAKKRIMNGHSTSNGFIGRKDT